MKTLIKLLNHLGITGWLYYVTVDIEDGMREIAKTSQKFFMLPTLEKDNRYDSWKNYYPFGDVYGYQVQMNEIIKIKTVVK